MAISEPIRKKGVAYYRHSAKDKQENSVPIQRGHTHNFTNAHFVEIIHEEADEGESGLSADRPAFKRLFKDWIENPNAPEFDYVFVYDVSRWGRFQDQDEAAHYEYLCKRHGKKVVYVSQGFPKEDEQLISTLQTSIGRYMAADYSRQLSGKVFHGCVKVSEQGFSAGGVPAYGMSRLLLDVNKKPIRKLKKGEWKSISNERVTFAPAEDETTETVKEMFALITEKWGSPQSIAEDMNAKGVRTVRDKEWKPGSIKSILSNEVYIGTRIYNKTWGRLKQKHRRNPRSAWVIQPNAFAATVTPEVFNNAQEHLYWLIPSKWRKGEHVVRKAEKNLKSEIAALLIKKGVDPDDAEMAVLKLPMVLGAHFEIDGVKQWCFVVKEYMKNYDYVLGVSLAIERDDPIDRFFWIPISTFDGVDFILFSENDPCCGDFTIPQNAVEEKILSIMKIAPRDEPSL